MKMYRNLKLSIITILVCLVIVSPSPGFAAEKDKSKDFFSQLFIGDATRASYFISSDADLSISSTGGVSINCYTKTNTSGKIFGYVYLQRKSGNSWTQVYSSSSSSTGVLLTFNRSTSISTSGTYRVVYKASIFGENYTVYSRQVTY